jgi:integrase
MAGQRRRRKGTGSIEKQPDGSFIARTSDRARSGRFASRSAAEAALNEWNRQQASGIDIAAGKQKVRTFLALWLDVVARKVRPSTHQFYTRHAAYTGPYIGDLALDAVRPIHLERMFGALGETSLSPRSIFHVRAVLRTAFNAAVKWKLLDESPVLGTDAPQVEDYPAQVLTTAEQAALLNAVAGHRLAALYHLALGLGLRRGELLTLRWDDYDAAHRVLYVRESKSKHGRRYLPLTEGQATVLARHRANQAEEGVTLQQRATEQAERDGTPVPLIRWNPDGYIFCSEVGTAILPRNLTRTFKATLARINADEREAAEKEGRAPREIIPEALRLHDLRHTAITFFVAGGADPKSAQALAGHADASTTMNLYAKSQAERLRSVVEAAERERQRKTG